MANSDFHPDDECEELARKLASSTVEDLRKSRESSHSGEDSRISLDLHARQLGIDAPLRDVSFVMEEFAWQWELAREFGGRMPCVRIGEEGEGETVPLSVPFEWPFPRHFRSWRWMRRAFPFPPDYFYEAYESFLRSRGEIEGIAIESADKALQQLQKGLGSFLAFRIAGFRAWTSWMMGGIKTGQGNSHDKGGKKPPGGGGGRGRSGSGNSPPLPPSSAPGGGLGVEVSCMTHGLNIEFSHCYFIHFLNFGAPSSPVKNTLLAGRYVFQGKGPMYPSGTSRSPIFCIPPDYKPVITYF
jgi:hypothetical protein